MINDFLQKAIERHLRETGLFFNILDDVILVKTPVENGRPLGELVLHMIRSLHFYLRGVVENIWEPLPYSFDKYSNVKQISELFESVYKEIKRYLTNLSSLKLDVELDGFNKPASREELILEMLEHSIHHRGQLSVYYRLLNLEPPLISYII